MGGNHKVRPGQFRNRYKARLRPHIVAAKEVDPVHCIARNQPDNFVQYCNRIKGAELWFQIVGRKPYRVAIGLAGLRAARLAHVSRNAARSEWNKRFYIRAYRSGQPHQNLELRLHSRTVSCLPRQLKIAEAVGHCAGLLIEAGRRKDHIGQSRRLSEE